jgi:tetratricopeptide (TPR) repeat protein
MGLLKTLFGKKKPLVNESLDVLLSTLPSELQQSAVLGCHRNDAPLDNKQFDMVIEYLKSERHPTIFIADILAARGEVNKALELCIKDDSHHIVTLSKERKAYQSGIDALNTVLTSTQKNNERLMHDLAGLYLLNDQKEQALSCYRQLVDRAIATGDIHYGISQIAQEHFGNEIASKLYLAAARKNNPTLFSSSAQRVEDPKKRADIALEGLECLLSDSYIRTHLHSKEVGELLKFTSDDARVIDLLEKHKCYDRAAQLSLRQGYKERAAENFLKMDNEVDGLIQAGDIFYELGMKERSVECYEKGFEKEKALSVAAEIKLTDKVFSLCEDYVQRDYGELGYEMLEKGARYALTQNLPEKAKELCVAGMKYASKSGDFTRAADFAAILGKEELTQTYLALSKL